MKQSLKKITLAGSTLVAATLFSFGWSQHSGVSLSIDKADARVGRPLTPVSVAGVARRQNRRAAYGAGVVGAGAAAVGTAAAIGTAGAIAATSPNWGWGGSPYQTGTGYYSSGPYYGGGVRGANAAYFGGYPSAAGIGTTPHYAVRAYYGGGPWYGYSGWDDYQARTGIRCRPGTMTKLDDGQMYACQ